MANEQHIEWLREGGVSWNARRQSDDFKPDFENADFRGTFRRSSQLSLKGGLDLAGANFRATKLEGAYLKDAILNDAQFGPASLLGANLENAQMRRANLKHTILDGANLLNAVLEGADLEKADILRATLNGARLESAQMNSANGDDASFAGAHLREAQLNGALLERTNFKSADLRGAQLAGASLLNARLDGADLRGAKLENAALSFSVLENADFRGADLTNANLERSQLNNTNLTGAKLDGAWVITDFDAGSHTNADDRHEYTDLSKTTGLTQEQLDVMRGDSGTILPEGLQRPEHWPELDVSDGDAPSRDETAEYQSEQDSPPTSIQPYTIRVQKRSVSQIRTTLITNYSEPQALTSYMVEQIQREIADHEMRAKGNTAEALNEWNAKHNFLKEMLVTVKRLNDQIPATPNEPISEPDAEGIKTNLVELAAKVDLAIKTLDNDKGTYGNFWKIGVIGAATQLLVAFGVTTTVAAPIAAGVVGVSTLRVLVGRSKDG